MRRMLSKGLFICLTPTLILTAASEAAEGDARKSVVAIHTFNINDSAWRRTGAGFLVTPEGHILTAKHVIENPPHLSVEVEFFGQAEHKSADVVRVDPYFDLAVLRVSGENLPPPMRFGRAADVKEGDNVRIIGHPRRGQQEYPFEIASNPIKSKSRGFLILGGDIFPGNSGGPVLDSRDEVIGVAISHSETYEESYVLPIHAAQDLLLAVGVDTTPGDVGTYQEKLAQLEANLRLLREANKKYNDAMGFLQSDLAWNIALRAMENESPSKGSVPNRDLEISYIKKFPDQYTPTEEIFLMVTPFFHQSAIDRQEEGKPKPNIRISMSARFRQTPLGLPVAIIPNFDQRLRDEIRGFNETNKTTYTVFEVNNLAIEILPNFKELEEETKAYTGLDYSVGDWAY
jgi:hypothetical protein